MEKSNILSAITITLLVIVIGLLLFENHQIDTVKHAVGVKESAFEEALHSEISGQPELSVTAHKSTSSVGE